MSGDFVAPMTHTCSIPAAKPVLQALSFLGRAVRGETFDGFIGLHQAEQLDSNC
jgi:hypothetical protein